MDDAAAPVIAFALVGGVLGKALTREETYQHLRVFEDVVSLISSNYVEEADMNRVMRGAMRGLAEGLDPDSAYLSADEVKLVEKDDKGPAGETGIPAAQALLHLAFLCFQRWSLGSIIDAAHFQDANCGTGICRLPGGRGNNL